MRNWTVLTEDKERPCKQGTAPAGFIKDHTCKSITCVETLYCVPRGSLTLA